MRLGGQPGEAVPGPQTPPQPECHLSSVPLPVQGQSQADPRVEELGRTSFFSTWSPSKKHAQSPGSRGEEGASPTPQPPGSLRPGGGGAGWSRDWEGRAEGGR